jgi:hypothetical protein
MKKLILLLTIVTLFGCKKDEVNDPPQFVVGVISENSVYKKFDPPIQLIPGNIMFSGNMLQDSIDVDNDGQYDFTFTCFNVLNNGMLTKESYIIISKSKFKIAYLDVRDINNVYVSGRNDTIFEYVYSYFKPFDLPYDTLIKEYAQTSEPTIFEYGTRTSKLNEWPIYDTFYFAVKDSTEYRWDNLKQVRFTNIEKGIWNEAGAKYLVYRLKEDNGLIYYGWLKVEISNFCNIRIFESCFQKDGFRE